MKKIILLFIFVLSTISGIYAGIFYETRNYDFTISHSKNSCISGTSNSPTNAWVRLTLSSTAVELDAYDVGTTFTITVNGKSTSIPINWEGGSIIIDIIIPKGKYVNIKAKTTYFSNEYLTLRPTANVTAAFKKELVDDNKPKDGAEIQIPGGSIYNKTDFYISAEAVDAGTSSYNYFPYESSGFEELSGIKNYIFKVKKYISDTQSTTILENIEVVNKIVNHLSILNDNLIGSGKYTISGVVYDANGNGPTPLNSKTVLIDADAPSAPESISVSYDGGTDSEDIVLSDLGSEKNIGFYRSPLYLSASIPTDNPNDADCRSGIDSYSQTMRINETEYEKVSVVNFSTAEEGGKYDASAYYFDNVGNKGNEASFNFYIDNKSPDSPEFQTTPNCIPGPNDNSLIFVPVDNQGYLAWEPSVDGTEEWQSGTDEYSYKLEMVDSEANSAYSASIENSKIESNSDGLYQTTPDELSMGSYTLTLNVSDKVGNQIDINTNKFTVNVSYAPEPVDVDTITLVDQGDGEFSLEWNYDNNDGAEGYCFDVKVYKTSSPKDSYEIWNYDDNTTPITWSEGITYTCSLPVDDLRTKVKYTARVYVMNADGFPMYTDFVFNLPNKAAQLTSAMFEIPEKMQLFGKGFPDFRLNSIDDSVLQDDEGDLLGLKLFYKNQDSILFNEINAGILGDSPVIEINADTDGTPELSTGVYDYYLNVVEYYEDWDGELKFWNEFERWPIAVNNTFVVDGNAPKGTLLAMSKTDDYLTIKATSLSDGSGDTVSGVSEIVLWNDGTGYTGEIVDYNSTTFATNVASGKGIRVAIADGDEITIEGWPFETEDGRVTASMVVIDDVGNESETVKIIEEGTNQAPSIDVYVSEKTLRVGEVWECPDSPAFYDAIDGEGDDLSWYWDFGDGTSSEEEYPIKTYTESGEYTVVLTVSDWWEQSDSVEFTFYAENTTEGTLLISENWSGEHTLTGDVVIPTGLSLTITEGTTVITPENTGIVVSAGASLTISGSADNKVNIGPVLTVEPYPFWNGLVINGMSNITFTNLKNGVRAIAAGPGSTVTLDDCNFIDNKIGLHIVGTSVILSGENSFIGNLWYGIKEDSVIEHPDLSGCLFNDNKNDYYHQDLLILNGDDLIEYIGN